MSQLRDLTMSDTQVRITVDLVDDSADDEDGDDSDPRDHTETPVSEIMTREVVCVTTDLTIAGLTALLDERGFGGVPVVTSAGELVGMVSKTDLVRLAHEEDRITPASPTVELRRRRSPGPGAHEIEIDARTIAEIMMPLAFSIPEHATIGHAAAIMASEGVHRLPVVDDGGRVVGLVTSTDVVRWVADVAGYGCA